MPMPPPSPLELSAIAKRLKRKPRAPSKRPQVTSPAFRPWRCVVLAVDPGESSGWAIYAHGKLCTFGTVDVFDHVEVARIVRAAVVTMAELAGGVDGPLPAVLVLERPWSARMFGASRPLWRKAWERAGMSERRIVRVYPQSWRAALLGLSRGTKQKGIRDAEQRRARAIAGVSTPIQHDAAAALCIGAWSVRAAAVGNVIPIRFRGELQETGT